MKPTRTKILIAMLLAVVVVGYLAVQLASGSVDAWPIISALLIGAIIIGVGSLATAIFLAITKQRKKLADNLVTVGCAALTAAWFLYLYSMYTSITF